MSDLQEKRVMSSLEIALIVRELNRELKDAYLRNIYQLSPSVFLLSLHKGERKNLLIDIERCLFLTSYDFKKPQVPTAFCMTLRKYLRNSRVIFIEQHEFERVVKIKLETRGETYTLFLEIFRRGNLVLANAAGNIIAALRYRKMKHRDILRDVPYIYPPKSCENVFSLSFSDFLKLFKNTKKASIAVLIRDLGLGKLYANELIKLLEIDPKKPAHSLSEVELRQLYDSLVNLADRIKSESYEPVIFTSSGRVVDFAPFRLTVYDHLTYEKCSSFNEAADKFFASIIGKELISPKLEEISKEREKLLRALKEQEDALKRLENEQKVLVETAELIQRNYAQLSPLIQHAESLRSHGLSWSEVLSRCAEDFKNFGLDVEGAHFIDKSIVLNISGRTFKLFLDRSLYENMAFYYEEAKRRKRKLNSLLTAIDDLKKKIEELERKTPEELKIPAVLRPKRKKHWYEKFRWFVSSDGFLVLGGRDSSTNEALIKRYTSPQDIVLHADLPGAPFVVIKTEGRPVPERTLTEAAIFAASYSRAWREGMAKCDVYWVEPSQVSKTAPSGEYLPTGAFMIYGKRNYIRGARIEVAVGLKREDDDIRVIGGPAQAIKNQSIVAIVLVPGGKKPSDLVKQIRHIFEKHLPENLADRKDSIALDEIQRFMPSGKSSIKEITHG